MEIFDICIKNYAKIIDFLKLDFCSFSKTVHALPSSFYWLTALVKLPEVRTKKAQTPRCHEKYSSVSMIQRFRLVNMFKFLRNSMVGNHYIAQSDSRVDRTPHSQTLQWAGHRGVRLCSGQDTAESDSAVGRTPRSQNYILFKSLIALLYGDTILR